MLDYYCLLLTLAPQSFRYRLAPRPLRAEGPSAPCAWPASAVRVTSELHCKGTQFLDAKQ